MIDTVEHRLCRSEMRNCTRIYFFLKIILFSGYSLAQSDINDFIVPDFNEGGKYINEYISGDNSDRAYVLKRDGFYLLSSTVENNSWTLRIKAENGLGRLPVIYSVPNPTTGNAPSPMFEAHGDIWMKGIAAVGYLESDTTQFSNMTGNIIVMREKGFSIVVDSCIFSTTKSSHIQTPSDVKKVKITNSIFSNGGSIELNNFGNGRGIDLRDVECDSLIVQNCTFINLQDRAVRHHATHSNINHFIFDHNTVTNSMGCHGTIFLSFVGESSVITNNLFVDNMVLGDDIDPVRQTYFENHRELNEFGAPRFTMIYSVPNDTTNWTVTNNFVAVTPALQAWYDGEHAEDSTFTGMPDPLTYNINSRLGADSINAFAEISISNVFFVKNTNTPIVMGEWYRTPPPNGPGKQKTREGFSQDKDYDRKDLGFFADTLDLSYDTTSKAYIGAKGFPAGDLNWFPELKAEWEKIGEALGVNGTIELPNGFNLRQNYPNPFNPETTISYHIPAQSEVTLKIYDILGREIETLVDKQQQPGSYIISWPSKNISSGIYFYTLLANSHSFSSRHAFIETRKMVLVR